jgi:hypothetical protein
VEGCLLRSSVVGHTFMLYRASAVRLQVDEAGDVWSHPTGTAAKPSTCGGPCHPTPTMTWPRPCNGPRRTSTVTSPSRTSPATPTSAGGRSPTLPRRPRREPSTVAATPTASPRPRSPRDLLPTGRARRRALRDGIGSQPPSPLQRTRRRLTTGLPTHLRHPHPNAVTISLNDHSGCTTRE